MWITLPRYFSVIAKRFSQPQGFLTRSDKLAEPELFFQRGEQLLDPLLGGRLAVDANQRFGAAETDQDPAAILQVVLEAIVRAGAHNAAAGNVGGRRLFQPAVELGATGRVLLPLEVSERTTSPFCPRFSIRYIINRAITWSWLMKVPRSSMMPTRSASPSLAMQRSKPPALIRSIASGM